MARTKSQIRTQKANIKSQVAAIKKNARTTIKNTIPKKIESTLFAVGNTVANKALEYTPVEYSLLQNSQYHIVETSPNGYRVAVGYTADYAAALHNRTDWNPRPIDQKKGPAWNPNATHHFLTRAADEEEVTINRIMLGDLEL